MSGTTALSAIQLQSGGRTRHHRCAADQRHARLRAAHRGRGCRERCRTVQRPELVREHHRLDLAGNAVAQTQSFTSYTLGPLPLGPTASQRRMRCPARHSSTRCSTISPARRLNVAEGTDVVLQTLNETKTANFELIQERFITGRITNAYERWRERRAGERVNAAGNFVTGGDDGDRRGVTGRYRTALQLAAGGPYYVRTSGGAWMGFNDQV